MTQIKEDKLHATCKPTNCVAVTKLVAAGTHKDFISNRRRNKNGSGLIQTTCYGIYTYKFGDHLKTVKKLGLYLDETCIQRRFILKYVSVQHSLLVGWSSDIILKFG
jgi:hypothetical protein